MGNCPCWVWSIAILTILGVAASIALVVYFTSNVSDVHRTKFGINNTNTIDVIYNTSIENNITSDNHNTIGVNVPVNNVMQPVVPIKNIVQPATFSNNTRRTMVKNNVSLTNVNNIKVFLDEAQLPVGKLHNKTFQDITSHVVDRLNRMTIQIIKFTTIIVAVVIIGVLGYCGTQCYVATNQQNNQHELYHQKFSVLQDDINRIKITIDESDAK